MSENSIHTKKTFHSDPFLNPLVVALDVDHKEDALRLADQMSDIVGGFKLGPRLCLRYGADLIQEISKRAPVFVDNKHFDIPSTMESAVRASFEAGASAVSVHGLAGLEALELMAKLEQELNQTRPFRILAITVLTSWNASSLPPILASQDIDQHVVQLAQFVKKCGLRSMVCSAQELNELSGIDLYKLTPGIRFDLEELNDQKRVMGPHEAIERGASAIVVGRPIIGAKDPRAKAMDYATALVT